MIINSASEILKQAKFLAQAKNSDFIEFDSAVSLLNNEYMALYNDIINNSSEFVKSFTFDGTRTPLPDDCYKVQMVTTAEGNMEITRAPLNKDVDGLYAIENNQIYICGNPRGTYIVKYSEMPASLTIPEDPVKLSNFQNYTVEGMNSDTVFLTNDGNYYEYDIKTDTLSEVDSTTYENDIYTTETDKYLGKDISFDYANQAVVWNDHDVSDNFIAYDTVTGEQLTFTKILISSPYLFIQYDNGEIYIMNGFSKTKWNVLVSKGIDTRGSIIAISTDDSTGKGVIVEFDNRQYKGYYYCSFVPDTILSYPDNTFFQLLEARIALQIRMLLGQDVEALMETVIPQYELNFAKSVSKSGPVRMKNVLGVY